MCRRGSGGGLAEAFGEGVDAVELGGDVDLLGAVGGALAAADAMVGLAELRDAAVVAYQEGAAGLPVVLSLVGFGDVPLVDAFVVVEEDSRDVEPVGAGHAVFYLPSAARAAAQRMTLAGGRSAASSAFMKSI